MTWYCVQTISKRERSAAKHLRKDGYEVYCPKTPPPKTKKKKDQEFDVEDAIAYFPCYIFINLVEGKHDFTEVKQSKNVVNIIRAGDHYVRIVTGKHAIASSTSNS